ncbi:4-hydroxybenzoate 3-monooxygenase [Amycolatopsis samaneae]|uniref:4-hydroxybenzoate 3-monooxygenase n=1 Tax=Amycolatopsis samaneae TaxID=664691 RepID=A0ABW5G9H2_9PSEU
MAISGKRADERPAVVVIGAGPAGLVLGNLLRAEGIGCLILERGTREHVQRRARAGFLAENSVRVLTGHGLAAGLLHKGQSHGVCAFRDEHGGFELDYGALGRGERHTVYPQQDLVTDLIAEFLARGGEIRFEATALDVEGADTDRPSVRYVGADGEQHRVTARFVAGCDGNLGVARRAVLDGSAARYTRDHGVGWLAILVEAPPSMTAVTYAIHENGFAGHMARSPSVTRYYLQCPPDDDPGNWPVERVWAELDDRMRTERYGPLRTGPILDLRVVRFRSDVLDPIQRGSLFLAGDAASLISPSAAKGANLAILEADVLAGALVSALAKEDEGPLAEYSATCLPRIWHAQEFSHWMIHLLHGPAGDDADAVFGRALQRARLHDLRTSRAHQDFFAENYVGI